MKTMFHGEQEFWKAHKPDAWDWRSTLVEGDPVKLHKNQQANPSRYVYKFWRQLKDAPRGVPAHLTRTKWCLVINSKGRTMPALLSSIVPVNRAKTPKRLEKYENSYQGCP